MHEQKVAQIMWNPNGKNFAGMDKDSALVFVYPQLQFFETP